MPKYVLILLWGFSIFAANSVYAQNMEAIPSEILGEPGVGNGFMLDVGIRWYPK